MPVLPVTGAAEGDALTELLGLNKSPSLNLGERWDLQADSLLPQSLRSCEDVSVWAMLLATPPLQAKQLSQPVTLSLQPFCAGDVFLQVKAIRRATGPARLIELARRKCWQDRLLKRAEET